MNRENRQTWTFQALDTLFFRESRPMESIGNAELTSLFPPSARTMVGAIRSAIGEYNNIDWREYRDLKEKHPLAEIIGYGDDNLGCLSFEGVWLQKGNERLYPAPLNLMQQGEEKDGQLFFIEISNDFTCTDIGNVRLPELKKEQTGSKVLENIWLTADEFASILSGGLPDPQKWFTLKPVSIHSRTTNYLLVEEARVGIARDNVRRNVEKSRLYQTRHVRLTDDVSLCMDISGVTEHYMSAQNNLTRLGGEARMASIEITSVPEFIRPPSLAVDAEGVVPFVLYLLTPLLISKKDDLTWQPLPGFTKCVEDDQTVWKGVLGGIDLKLHTAITGKAHREGGWDMPAHKPKPVRSYIPAGSVFYCTCSGKKPQDVVDALHGTQIGEEQKLGRGKIVVGLWK